MIKKALEKVWNLICFIARVKWHSMYECFHMQHEGAYEAQGILCIS